MIFRSLRTPLAIAGSVLALAIAAPAAAAPVTFTITIDDGNSCLGTWQTTGSASNPTIACVTDGTPPPAVGKPTCSGYSGAQTITAGTSVTLTLGTCSAPAGGVNTYKWTAGSPSGTVVATSSIYPTPVLASTTTYYATVTGSDGQFTTYPMPVTVTSVTPPPATSKCSNYTAVSLGDLSFDGGQIDSFNMRGSAVSYGRIVIPNPLPAGWAGRTAQVSVFEHGEGAFWKKVHLSKVACDFAPATSAWGQGTGVTLYMTFGGTGFGTLTVQPGDVWYVNVKNESIFGTSSCGAGLSCNFGLRLYPPSN